MPGALIGEKITRTGSVRSRGPKAEALESRISRLRRFPGRGLTGDNIDLLPWPYTVDVAMTGVSDPVRTDDG